MDMDWINILKTLTPTAMPSILILFLILKFNKLEHQLKDIKNDLNIWIRDNYVNKKSCIRCQKYTLKRIEESKIVKHES